MRLLTWLRGHAAEPRAGIERMHWWSDGRLVLQPAHDRELLLEPSERLEDRPQLEAGARGRGRPVLHDGAMRQVHESHARLRRSSGVNQLRPRRDHGIEERQSNDDTGTAKKSATRKMLLCNEHDGPRS